MLFPVGVVFFISLSHPMTTNNFLITCNTANIPVQRRDDHGQFFSFEFGETSDLEFLISQIPHADGPDIKEILSTVLSRGYSIEQTYFTEEYFETNNSFDSAVSSAPFLLIMFLGRSGDTPRSIPISRFTCHLCGSNSFSSLQDLVSNRSQIHHNDTDDEISLCYLRERSLLELYSGIVPIEIPYYYPTNNGRLRDFVSIHL